MEFDHAQFHHREIGGFMGIQTQAPLGGRNKGHLLRLPDAVVPPQMPIDPHGEGSSILVPQPARNRCNIDSAFNADCGKKVA